MDIFPADGDIIATADNKVGLYRIERSMSYSKYKNN